MLTFMYIISIILEIGIPIGLAVWLTRRYKYGWGVVGVGVLTFIASQVIHIPLLAGIGAGMNALKISFPEGTPGIILSGLYLGLMAGICEEPMRYLGFKLLKRRAKPFESGLLAGVGHGGVESILVGVTVLVNMVVMSLVAKGGLLIPEITPEMITAFSSSAWYTPLLGAVERMTTIVLHITLSVMVWRSVSQRKIGWLFLAIAYHMVVDAFAVIASLFGVNALFIEAAFVVMTVINIGLLQVMKKNWKQVQPAAEVITEH